jgi:hypothetical protein
MRGTNLGGFLVLEPWITPSIFYQFLGVTEPSKVGMDMLSFCTALGDVSIQAYIQMILLVFEMFCMTITCLLAIFRSAYSSNSILVACC